MLSEPTKWIVGRIACDGEMTLDDLFDEIRSAVRDAKDSGLLAEERAILKPTARGREAEEAARKGCY